MNLSLRHTNYLAILSTKATATFMFLQTFVLACLSASDISLYNLLTQVLPIFHDLMILR